MSTPTDLLSLTEPELVAWLEARGQKRFRAKQIRRWLFEKGAATVSEMSDLSKALRHTLSEEALSLIHI